MLPCKRAGVTLLGLLAAGGAAADTARFGDQRAGNTLNPPGEASFCERAAQGLSIFTERPRRSPSGLRYRVPCRPPEDNDDHDQDEDDAPAAIAFSGAVELGLLSTLGDDDAQLFNEYTDWDEGLLLNALDLRAREPEGAHYAELSAAGPTRDDGYARAELGRRGSWSIGAFYNGIPQVLATRSRSLFEGVGTSELRLPAGLEPGRNSPEAVAQAFAGAPLTPLSVQRDRTGVTAAITPTPNWRIFGGFRREDRDGTKALGGAMFFNWLDADLGSSVELIQPVNYVTYDARTGVQYAGDTYRFNLLYTGSFFTNDNDTLVWEHPFRNGSVAPREGGAFVTERGRFDLAPDNEAHHLKLELARSLPWRGQITTTASIGRMTQDDRLIPPTINGGAGGTSIDPIDLNAWTTAQALSRQRADARIDTWLFHTRVRLRPWRALTLRAEARWRNEDNDTEFVNFNPLTGQYGTILTDGGVGGAVPFRSGLFRPGRAGSRQHIRAIPFATDRARFELAADYRLTRASTVTLALKREDIEHAHRERDETEEHEIELRWNYRGADWANLRMGYRYAERDGDAYDPFPYAAFYTESLPQFMPRFDNGTTPHTLASLRKFDLADRQRHRADAKLNLLLRDDLELMLTGRFEDRDLDAQHGRRNNDRTSANAELSWAPSTATGAYLYFSRLSRDLELANISSAGALAPDGSPGGPVFPQRNAWAAALDERDYTAGVGVEHRFELGDLELSSDVVYVRSRSEIALTAASAGAAEGALPAGQTRSSLPEIAFERLIWESSLLWPFAERWRARFYYRYEDGDIEDFHFDGVGGVIRQQLYLGTGQTPYQAHAVGAFLQYRF